MAPGLCVAAPVAASQAGSSAPTATAAPTVKLHAVAPKAVQPSAAAPLPAALHVLAAVAPTAKPRPESIVDAFIKSHRPWGGRGAALRVLGVCSGGGPPTSLRRGRVGVLCAIAGQTWSGGALATQCHAIRAEVGRDR